MSTAQNDPTLFAAWAHLMAETSNAVLVRRLLPGRPVWIEDLETRRGNVYRVLITDDRPPQAHVLRPRLAGSPHRYTAGQLCLGGAYRPSLTPLAVRTRTIAWLEAFEHWKETGHWLFDE